MFSINGTVNRPAGTAAINKTLIIYLDMYVTVGKLGRNTIQVKFLVELQMDLQLHQVQLGLKLLKPITHAKDPKIVTGNMYSKSFGKQAHHSNCVPYL
jgi:hypothetical protein